MQNKFVAGPKTISEKEKDLLESDPVPDRKEANQNKIVKDLLCNQCFCIK